ncbi:restriction endonuclease subunit S [Paenibacillus cellulositrophicus]|uniref:restriction endonuclease subunit S n=1 Tax=Paenibacillus cellulositrophicus TaxID=562959 RepID=UPI00203BBA11|nr:restriction endonuclease subunit S [Paenibacillus cellulositrophicus]MCM2999974.1 restriction endonuclease subunit S [Paenibacillus cellulositrophicus]
MIETVTSNEIDNEQVPYGYKKEHVGFIPEHWTVKKFKSIFKVNQGLQIPISERLREPGDNSYFYITNEFIKNRGKGGEEFYISNPPKNVICSKNDILMTRTGNTGIVLTNVEGVFHNNFFKIEFDRSLLDANYVFYYLNSAYVQKKIKIFAGASTIPDLNHSDFYKIDFLYCDIKEQQKIASILSTWDKAIGLKEKLIEQKKEQKKGLMQKLLMGHIRWNDREKFSNEEIQKRLEMINRGEVPSGYRKTKVGIIPIEWKIVHLKEKFDRLTKKNTINNKNVLTISAQQGLVNQGNYFKKSVASENVKNYFLLLKGDFAYNKSYSTGYPYGAIKKLKLYKEGVVSPLYICFTPNKKNQCPEYYEYYFEAGNFNREIHAIAQEGARNHGLLNVPINDFFNLYIIDFDVDEMIIISNIISTSVYEIELLEKELDELRNQKRGLMQLLLTGKVRVKV